MKQEVKSEQTKVFQKDRPKKVKQKSKNKGPTKAEIRSTYKFKKDLKPNRITNEKGFSKKAKKTAPLVNGEKQNAIEKRNCTLSLKMVDSKIFSHFTDLVNENEKIRIQAMTLLIRKLKMLKDTEKRKANLDYALKRLVRGCGASTQVSRTTFFKAFLALLRTFPKEITEEQVFDMIKKELNTGTHLANKDDAFAIEGRIFVCGALIQSGRIGKTNAKNIEEIFNILLQSASQVFNLAASAFTFMSELINEISAEQFEQIIWPKLQSIILVPWPKQAIHTLHCLLFVKSKFPEILTDKLIKMHLGNRRLLYTDNYEFILKLFWGVQKLKFLTHPAFDSFGQHFSNNPNILDFWTKSVDQILVENVKELTEFTTIKILTSILKHINPNGNIRISEFLTPNFIRIFISKLKYSKTKKNPLVKNFNNEFIKSLIECCAKIQDDSEKVEIIRKLILHPGIFNIEKFTGRRIIHQIIGFLGETGTKEIFQLYKEILLNMKIKNENDKTDTWLNIERQNAGYTLQYLLGHKSIQYSYDWRMEQLQFIMNCGIFNVNDSNEICKKDAAGQFSKDFGDQMKNIFYSSLQSKFTNQLKEEKRILLLLAKICNDKINAKNANKYFRISNFNVDSIRDAWNKVYLEVTTKTEENNGLSKSKKKKKENKDKLEVVFHILLLNMGLQLFNEANNAISAIDDLCKCMERAKKGETKSKIELLTKKSTDQLIMETPDWIEVIVDLFLHLLSQNTHSLRTIVTSLFSHLCGSLSFSAIHQILSMLDMKDDNPLCLDDEELGEEEMEEEEKVKEEKINKDNESSDDEDDDDDDDDDDDEDDDDLIEENEDEGTSVDKLRNAISLALVKEGAAAATINGNNCDDDDDMCSIDLNDMTKEEGERLDRALAEAFKAHKAQNGISNASKKRTKNQRSKDTIVMHFRIRVLDLIEVYLHNSPALFVCNEIMLTLYNMIEYCDKEELKPLQIKVEKVLNKLTSLRHFEIVGGEDEDKEKNLVNFIRLITEKKISPPTFDINNRLRNKCILFLINNSKHLPNDIDDSEKNPKYHQIIVQLIEYCEDFIKSRNPIVNISLFLEIFKLNWPGLWQLAVVFAENGYKSSVRTFRRIQINEILTIFYKNTIIFQAAAVANENNLKKIENCILNHLKYLGTNENVQHISDKEFQTLLELLLTAQAKYKKLNSTIKSVLNGKHIGNLIQNIRKKFSLEDATLYTKFCHIHQMEIIKNSDLKLDKKAVSANGNCKKRSKSQNNDDSDGDEEKPIFIEKKLKSETDIERKSNSKEAKIKKKHKKQQRMEASSKGLNDSLSFSQVALSDDDKDDIAEDNISEISG